MSRASAMFLRTLTLGGAASVVLVACNTMHTTAATTQAATMQAATAQPAAVPPPAGAALRIIAIDVDGGAATLYIAPEGQSLLIDTGWPPGRGGPRRPPGNVPGAAPSASVAASQAPAAPQAPAAAAPSSTDRIVAAARAAGLNRLDYVLITHYHVDHVGGLAELLGKFPVGTILDHGPNRELENVTHSNAPATEMYADYEPLLTGRSHRSLQVGDAMQIGSMRMSVVTSDRGVPARPLPGAGQPVPECATHGSKTEDGGEENARSLGVLISYGRARVMSLGDLTWDAEKALVCPVNRVGQVDLFFANNHGSNYNNSPALVHALAPRVAVMANGSRKGGDPDSVNTLLASPGLQRLWQLHRANKGGNERNTPDGYIANLTDDPDAYAPLKIAVFADGRLTFENGRTGFTESYPATDSARARN